ncbi:protein lifeguard 1-like isoform X2 [Oratosquilla oratoria]|uniref:protein lifeguard 1-like isoform X2 n=1 Tax=Oratosquilla oratoria TaxID=337810 RepID=UPI003F76A2DA
MNQSICCPWSLAEDLGPSCNWQQPPGQVDPERKMYSGDNYEEPLESSGALQFSEKSVRMGFIRKVYMILMAQLSVSFAFVAIFSLDNDVYLYTLHHPALFWCAFAMTLVCIVALSCCGSLRRRTPHNYIFLGIFTVCEGFILGTASATYAPFEVLLAVGICVVVTLALTLFAFQTKIDFTMCSSFLFVGLIILIIFGILAIIFQNKVLNIVYASLGALIFSLYIVFDTQLMMGGSHKYSISPEEYIFAALTLYLDIINLFQYILHIIGMARN